MRHSTKMGIVSLILSLIGLVSWSYLNYLVTFDLCVPVYFILPISGLLVVVVFGSSFYRHATRHMIKKARRLQPQIKFCFFCGTTLPLTSRLEASRLDVCPACNSNLNLVEIIDN